MLPHPYDIVLDRIMLRVHGADVRAASQIDVWGPAPVRHYIGRLARTGHTSARAWHYPEPSGGSSNIEATTREWLRRQLEADPRTAALAGCPGL